MEIKYPEILEKAVFQAASRMLVGYGGGQWTKDKLGFIYPDFVIEGTVGNSNGDFNLVGEGNYSDERMGARACGLALTTLVTNHLAWYFSDNGSKEKAQAFLDHWNYLTGLWRNPKKAGITEKEMLSISSFLD